MRVKELYERAMAGERFNIPWKKEDEDLIECYDEDGLLVGVYNSMTEAAEDTCLSVAAVSMCISGKRKHIGPYTFKRVLQ